MQIKVMTFNLRLPVEADGINHFLNRRERIRRVIEEEKPDLIGFQEATDLSLSWLRESFPDYYFLGHGRDKNMHGEGAPLAYRKDRFLLHSFREEWMSLTPEKPGSRFKGADQSNCPRVYCRAELIAVEGDTPFVFYNTHNDNRGQNNSGRLTRVLEASIIMRDVSGSPYGYILTGDFNELPDGESIALIMGTANSLGTVDLTAGIRGSFHGFGRADCGTNKIDYIFTNLPGDPKQAYAVADAGENGVFYSDHNAICALVEV